MAPSKLSKKKNSKNNNPYSSRGLDKFSAVLAELQAKEKKIMSGANGIALVRFMYSNSRDWTPVVVRHREDDRDDDRTSDEEAPAPAKMKMEKREMEWWRWRPSYYMLVVMLIILVCLVVSGRAMAVGCVSAWWYLLPVLKGEESGDRGRRWGRKSIGG